MLHRTRRMIIVFGGGLLLTLGAVAACTTDNGTTPLPGADAGRGSDGGRPRADDAEASEDALQWHVVDDGKAFSAASGDFQFASAVAGFGMLLRNSEHKGNLTCAAAIELAQGGQGSDEGGYRAEFIEMIRRAKQLRGE